VGVLAAWGLLTPAAPAARAQSDDFVVRANRLYSDIAPSNRSDTVVLPAASKMSAAPAGLTFARSRLLSAGGPGWSEAEAWAMGPEQRGVLEAIEAVTRGEDWRRAMAFGQPYGIEGVPIELVRARLYTELGDPALLSAARPYYLEALETVAILCNVEATRLGASGHARRAIDVMVNWTMLARQIADRQLTREAAWGLGHVAAGLERVRDLAAQDFTGARALTAEDYRAVVARLDEESGPLSLDRVKFPMADELGARQALGVIYSERGGLVNQRVFAPTLSRLGASEHPLKLFGESTRLSAVAAVQADKLDAEAELPKVFDDFSGRWRVDWWDRRMKQPYHATQMDRNRFAAIAAATPDMGQLFGLRQAARTEAVGTRQALAVGGYLVLNRSWPPTVESTRPRFVRAIEADPLNPDRAAGRTPAMEYFVPNGVNARPLGPRDEPRPHRIEVVNPRGTNFAAFVPGDNFVMYSVGADGARGWADQVQNTAAAKGADYLIWPPLLTLERAYLKQVGQQP